MIEAGSTSSSEDAGFVELESRLIGLNCDGDWSLGQSLHERLFIVFFYILVTCHTTLWDAHSAARSLASAGLTFVGVALFGADGIFLRKFECIIHQTAVAALVNFVAIYELLLTE